MMKHLFDNITLKNLKANNRLVRSATWEGIANRDGSVTEEAYSIYDEVAKGGVGVIITGFTSVAANDYPARPRRLLPSRRKQLRASRTRRYDDGRTPLSAGSVHRRCPSR